jgi:hypothetical protein
VLSSRFRWIVPAPVFALAFGALACSSSPPAGPVGGPVADAASTRCIANGMVTPAKVGACLPPGSGGDDAGASVDGGADAASGTPSSVYGETLYNSSGYDDDCKYHLSFMSTPIRKNADVTFTVTVEGLDPAGPATGAGTFAEVYLNPIHPAPNSDQKTTETPAGSGVYKVGPIVFDASGIWTVRFHMYETCSDAPADSPHGHAAFYIEVP